jgi:hypothetical protein
MGAPKKIAIDTDLTGRGFGRLTVIAFGGRTKSRKFWLCRCTCGTETRMREDGLVAGNQSCGCLTTEVSAANGKASTKHGHTSRGKRSRTYVSWVKMRRRCLVPADEHYRLYGGRGITVCRRWLIFENFLADMGERPEGTTLDRYPDKNGNYEPGNCRWATQKEQCNNTRLNVMVEYQGVTKTATQWAESMNWPKRTVYMRLRAGWTVERALTTTPNRS